MISPYHQQRFLQQLATIVGARFPDFCDKMRERGQPLLPEGVPIFRSGSASSSTAPLRTPGRYPYRLI